MNRFSPARSLSLSTALASACVALVACGAPPAARDAASQATVDAHVAAATNAAGSDLQSLAVLCRPVPATRPPQADSEHAVAALMAKPAPAPGQAFDELYYVGADWVSAWALKTSDGIILFDALNNEGEARDLIEGGLRKLGLDPAQIRIIVVTHGHGDHYGGAAYLAKRYGARIVMSAADWQMTAGQLEFSMPLWGAPPVRDPSRDLTVKDGDTITLGGTVVTLYLTPGHTTGTISPVFDVHVAGQPHRALLWGGTAFNFGKIMPRLDTYIAATDRMRDLAPQQGIDVMISNHAAYDNTFAKLDRLRGQGGLQPDPFVLGVPTVQRALTVMGECARATRDRFSM